VTHQQSIEAGRAAFEKNAWADAYALLSAADAQTPLDPDDLDRLATAAFLIGEDAAGIRARTRAHAGFLERADPIRAARTAFWLGFTLLDQPGQAAQAGGWLARAQRLVDAATKPCVEEGWLLCASARQGVAAGDIPSAHDAFKQAAEIGERFHDRDLLALARHGQGRTLLFMKQTATGLALLDEVMVGVTGGEISPIIAGIVYCSVISACHDLFDLRRANEWTAAFQSWCAGQPDLVPFRGLCLIHRSELMQLHGAWQDAFGEARDACKRIAAPSSHPEAGAAYYQLAELHRLRGEFVEADEAYRLASQMGRKPQPGLALLRLSQGQTEAADTSIRLALHETRGGRSRVFLLSAAVEIMLATNDIPGARTACDELAQRADQFGVPFLRALAAQARGAVGLAEAQPLAALEVLSEAMGLWHQLDAPFELAQVRALIGAAHRSLGDDEGARLEFEAAHETFENLGATPAAARVAVHLAPPASDSSTGLTGREIEVLRLIATGVTNRTIAARLSISEKTVARHVSNIFTKLDLSSRAAATAYAYEHKLL